MSQESVERGVRSRLSLPSGRSAQRRSLDERFFVRFPAAYRLGAAAWMRLSPESRLRRLVLARIGGRAMAAVNRRDFAVLFLAVDPNIEYHPAGDQLPLDMDEVSHGHEGYEKVWRQMIDSFEDFRGTPQAVIDLGDQFLAIIRYTGHGSGSGVPVDIPLFQLMRLRRGLVVWQRDYSDRSQALEAAGLSE
jgi:ketosteroid isomerase-like protein